MERPTRLSIGRHGLFNEVRDLARRRTMEQAVLAGEHGAQGVRNDLAALGDGLLEVLAERLDLSGRRRHVVSFRTVTRLGSAGGPQPGG